MKLANKPSQGRGNHEKTICTKCKENYEQACYMIIKRKWVKIGIGCPECLKGELNK